jgi:LysR family nitrogen assimilation transcriptional regulator
MDVKKFDYFLKVADHGSISRAAASLHVSQPVLSRQIRKLEEELGLPLFYRNGRGVTLTPGGQSLMENARAIQRAIDLTISELGALKNQFAGSATIGMPSSVGRVLTVPLARHFREHFPDVQLRIVEGFSGDIAEWLHHGRLDVAITYSPGSLQGIVADPVAIEELMLFSPQDRAPGETVDLEKIVTLPLILPGRSHTLRVELDRAARHAGFEIRPQLEVDSLHSMLRLVSAGFGHSLLPPAAAPEPAQIGVTVTAFRRDPIQRTLHLASAPQRSNAVPLGRLATVVRKQMLDLAGPATWRAIPR